MSVVDKIGVPVKPDDEKEFLIEDDAFQEQFPGLFEVLCRCKYQGHPRVTGRLILFAELDRATLCLCDKQSGQVCFFTSKGFNEALEGLERALQAGKADWRADKRSTRR